MDADAPPPPNGTYRVVALAKDTAGNEVRVEHPLVVRDGGQPRADILGEVIFDRKIVRIGDTLAFTATVKNIGSVPLRTFGPTPGTEYSNTESFNTMVAPDTYILVVQATGYDRAHREIPIETGRVLTHDFRLEQDGTDRMKAPAAPILELPGQINPEKTTICGQVSASDGLAVAGAKIYVFESDGDGILKTISDAQGRYCFANLHPGRRDYSRRSGAIRLGLEYDEKLTDLAYPYRWQIGSIEDLEICESENVVYLCLPPQKQTIVTGRLQINDPPYRRSTNFYVALLHEDVRRIVGPYGIQNITIEY